LFGDYLTLIDNDLNVIDQISMEGHVQDARLSQDGHYVFFIQETDNGSYLGAASACNLSDVSLVKVSSA